MQTLLMGLEVFIYEKFIALLCVCVCGSGIRAHSCVGVSQIMHQHLRVVGGRFSWRGDEAFKDEAFANRSVLVLYSQGGSCVVINYKNNKKTQTLSNTLWHIQ